MQVRLARVDDAEAIADVHLASIREAYRHLFPAEALAQLDAQDRVRRWREHLAKGTSLTLLGEIAGRLVGFADFGACRDPDVSGAAGELMALYVLPEAWGRGLGTALLRQALDRLRGDGFAEVVLCVLEGNKQALRFYEKFGFVRDGSSRHREVYGAATTVVRLRLGAGATPASEAVRIVGHEAR